MALASNPIRRIARSLVGALAWLSLGAALTATWLVLARDSDELQTGVETIPVVVVAVASESRSESVSVRLLVNADEEPVTSAGSGRISRLRRLPETMEDGDDLVWAEVDGRPMIVSVYQTDSAFYRPLTRGSSGSDVELLERFLTDRGFYSHEISGKFGYRVEQALLAWRKAIDAGDSKSLLPDELQFVGSGGSIIMDDMVEAGSFINTGAVVMRLRRPGPVLSVRLPIAMVSSVAVGDQVLGDGFSGHVTQIATEPIEIDGEPFLILRVEPLDSGGPELHPGESLGVRIQPPATERLWLPAAAVALNAEGGTYVTDEAENEVGVVVGDPIDGFVPLESGLDVGDKVLTPNPGLIYGDS